MIEYKYTKVKGHEQKKFTENGHTMFETDVLRRLERLTYLENKMLQLESSSVATDCENVNFVKDDFSKIAEKVEKEWNMGGLSDSMYEEYARECFIQYFKELIQS